MNWFKKLFSNEEYADVDLCNAIYDKLGFSGYKEVLSKNVAKWFVQLIQKEEGNCICFNRGWINCKSGLKELKENIPYCQNCCWSKWCK